MDELTVLRKEVEELRRRNKQLEILCTLRGVPTAMFEMTVGHSRTYSFSLRALSVSGDFGNQEINFHQIDGTLSVAFPLVNTVQSV